MKKKMISLLTIAVLMASMAISCGKNSNDSKADRATQDNSQPYGNVVQSEDYAPAKAEAENGVEKTVEEYQQYNSEEYNSIVENDFTSVKENSISTFSADVDTASYTKLKSMIQNGYVYDTSSLRIEEMLNYFHYDYSGPTTGEPFGINTELGNCPWNPDNKILAIGLQTQDIPTEELPKSNLVFLLDTSGSMSDADKLPLMVQAFKMLTEELGENDRISIVTYAGSDEILIDGKSGKDKLEIVNALESLSAEGSTNGSDGIKTAYKLAEKYFIKDGNNRVILATDGDLNVGVTSEEGLTRLIEEKRDSGIFLSVLGLGSGNYKDNKLEALADNGNGNYNYIDSRQEAKKVLVEEMGGTLITVAKDVKLQVEFNSETVKEYRLIGYENRMLRTEDFEDDTKDAGEIGAGHQVTALYEVVLKENTSSDLATLRLRYKAPDSNTSKELTYPLSTTIQENASDNFTFACCVAETGMLLRDSKFVKDCSYADVLASINSMNTELDPYKLEFKELVKELIRGIEIDHVEE